jgi:hypothetical protein
VGMASEAFRRRQGCLEHRVSDYVFSHGLTAPTEEADVTKAHQKLLGSLAPIANELSEVSFRLAAALFRKYIADEITMTVVAKIADASNISDLYLPFYVEIA